ncbi:MAG: cold shock domain-containing protein [Pseudomonadota bacterium]
MVGIWGGWQSLSSDYGKDVFVHIRAVERSGLTGLADNRKVSYELEAGRDGRESAGSLELL